MVLNQNFANDYDRMMGKEGFLRKWLLLILSQCPDISVEELRKETAIGQLMEWLTGGSAPLFTTLDSQFII